MTLVHVTDHVRAAWARLIEQFRDKDSLKAFVASYIKQIQGIEDACFDLLAGRIVDDAEGELLDFLGRIVGQERLGYADDAYRALVRARVRLNVSSGTPEDLIALAQLLGVVPVVTEHPPAGVTVVSTEPITNGDLIATLMNLAKAAGVRLVFEWHHTAPAFTFENGDGAGFGAGTWANASDGA
jgi:hypothetical protein